ncbi:MAG: hypothetical protein M3144_08640 [Actinomycetota bacterium]|nr:hypothetical protein [Actinomycetota bacterium]
MGPLPLPATDATELLRARDGLYADDLLVVAAAYLDLFTSQAEEPCDLPDLARRFGLACRPTDAMCILFVAMGLLEAASPLRAHAGGGRASRQRLAARSGPLPRLPCGATELSGAPRRPS